MRDEETLDNLHFQEELKMIDICAIGPLRITSGIINAGLLKEGSKIVMITSQGGSVSWRSTQNPNGHDYGHHVSLLLILFLCRTQTNCPLENASSLYDNVFLVQYMM